METMKNSVERYWICIHGAPSTVSGDDAYDKPNFHKFLKQHNITYKPRPARRHNKLGSVERKNQTVKCIIRKLDNEITNADTRTVVARAVFLSNMFSGSKILSSFQLAKGYTPSIIGIPQSHVTTELLQAHKEQAATRALQKLLHAKNPSVLQSDILKPGDPIWVYYETSSKAKKKEWVKASVVQAERHRVLARRSEKGPPMRVAYEDVRIAPNSKLTQDLMSQTLEEELATDDSVTPHTSIESMHNRDDGLSDRGVVSNGDSEDPTCVPYQPTSQAQLVSDDESPPGMSDIPTSTALLANTITLPDENPEADIGTTTVLENHTPNRELSSDRTRVMEDMARTIGKAQVTSNKLEFAPSWIVEEAFNKEHTSNWADAYEVIDDSILPLRANVISSHVIYKVKTSEDGSHTLKARIVPHGNKDVYKDDIRKDSSTAQFDVIRILLAAVTFLGMRLAMADIKGAYLQSGPIQREIYVRPPREWTDARGKVWKLTKLPYGIVEAGRQWAKTIEDWMLNRVGLQRIKGLNQIYVLRDSVGKISLIVAKVTDDFICGGAIAVIQSFLEDLKKRFEVGKVIIDSKFHFNGCEIEQDASGSITMMMNGYMKELREISLSKERRKQLNENATESETTLFRSLAGTMLWLGKGVLPPAAYASSAMQQRLSNLKVGHVIEANDMVRDIKKLDPTLFFRQADQVKQAWVTTFSDASFNISSRKSYGQTGVICGIRTTMNEGSEQYYVIDWVSTKQKRISHSSYGAEILACAEADDRGYYIKTGMRSLFPKTGIRSEIVVDSKGLFDTISTLHEGREYRLRQTVQRIRDSFESKEVDVIRWIPGIRNVADSLTKRNVKLWNDLNGICATGILDSELLQGQSHDSTEWK